MKIFDHSTAQLFRQEVACYLELPRGSSDADVRRTLLEEGPDFVAWYDTRLRAIAAERQPARRMNPPD